MRTSRGTPPKRSVREAVVPVRAPYRLDLTAIVLRRLSTNVVDVFDGTAYRRALAAVDGPVVLTVTQPAPDKLEAHVQGPSADAFDPAPLVRAMLGTEVDLAPFYAGAARFAWLHRIAAGAHGVRPPRYPSLWEAACNAVVYQQVSIHAAGAILRRVIERLVAPVDAGGSRLYPFPPPAVLLDASDDALRAAGLSINKVRALRAIGTAIASGELDERALEALPTAELLAVLSAHRGIGPWTAAVIALRGFGRLDVFPMNDSGAAASLRALSGEPQTDPQPIVEALRPQQGMLYYHLLLGRLHARGEIRIG